MRELRKRGLKFLLIPRSRLGRTFSRRDKELLEPICEIWRRSDKVPSTGGDQALGVECCGKCIADPLEPRRVFARGHERWDTDLT